MRSAECARWCNECLRRGFAAVGKCTGTYPWHSIAMSLVLVAVCGLGLLKLDTDFSVRKSFTPAGSRAEREARRYRDFYDGTVPYYAQLLVAVMHAGESKPPEQPATAPNLLDPLRNRPDMFRIEAVSLLATHVLRRITVEFNGRTFAFADLCGSSCDINEPLTLFAAAYAQSARNFVSTSTNSNGTSDKSSSRRRSMNVLDFPVSSIVWQDVRLTHHLYGVKTNRTAYQRGEQVSALSHVNVAVLTFRADNLTAMKQRALARWELELDAQLEPFRSAFPELSVTPFGDHIMTSEMVAAGFSSAPYLTAGFIGMVVFVMLVVPTTAYVRYRIGAGSSWFRQVLLALTVVASPGCAMLAGFGTFYWLCPTFTPGLIGIPFLVLAVGVDDAFLLINSFQRHQAAAVKPGTGGDRAQLLSAVMVDVGPSVFITSATNAIAFGIGCSSPTADVWIMCAIISLCISFDLLLQLSLFSPCMLLLMTTALQPALSIDDRLAPSLPETLFLFFFLVSHKQSNELPFVCRSGNQPTTTTHSKLSSGCDRICSLSSRCVSRLCRLLTRWQTQTCVLLLAAVHFGCMLYLCLQLVPQLRCWLYVDGDGHSNYFMKTLHFFIGYQPIIMVNAPLRFPADNGSNVLDQTMQLVLEVESLPESKGAAWSTVWLRDYVEFERKFFSSDFHKADVHRPLEVFLASSKYRKYRTAVKHRFDEYGSQTIVDAFSMWFSFVIADEHQGFEVVRRLRSIIDSYPALNASLYRWDNFSADQVATLPSQALQIVLITIACMAVICALTIPSLHLLACTLATILSICVGVVGWLVLWGAVLDPPMVSAILMTIGFSVDYTAHVAYHYYMTGTAGYSSPAERLESTLGSVLLPMLQAAGSTGVIVIALAFTTSYVAYGFFKSLCLVVIQGVLHGVIVLPVLITLSADTCRSKNAQFNKTDR